MKDNTDPRAQYWGHRYTHLDWTDGIHIGRFAGLDGEATLQDASGKADDALIRDILEQCSLFRLMTDFRVLEIGCGAGGLGCRLIEALPRVSYKGFDISETAIEIAETKVKTAISQFKHLANENVGEFQVGGVSELLDHINQLRSDEAYDLIIIREVFYMLSSEERVALSNACSRGLRQGGFVYLADIFVVADEPSVQRDIQLYLYERHHSTGPQLKISSPEIPAFTSWVHEVFSNMFELVNHEVDFEGVPMTYRAALKLDIAVQENKVAYQRLAELGDLSDANHASIFYVKCFLFRRNDPVADILKNTDYNFRVRRNFHSDVLRTGETYGAVLQKWNLIIGRSGSGKTTLLRALEGELSEYIDESDQPSLIDDTNYFFLPQSAEIFEGLSPVKNVQAFGSNRDEAIAHLKQLGLCSEGIMRKSSFRLSGGEKQRVAIAQCMASRANTILLDEPLKGLDKARRAVLFELLASTMRGARTDTVATLICVDHDFESIFRRFDFVFEMLHGKQVLVWKKEVVASATTGSIE